jgi:methionyl-tRNA synthetase
MVKEKFYITTTIPYANAPPHIGFTLELVQADVLARWHKLKGKDVFFLTGTDEHGVKNYQTAKKQGINTQKFVDKNSDYFKKLTKSINCSNNYFIRTTDKKVHWPGVVEMWNLLLKKGDIYKKKYSGNYCSGCERFITDKDLVDGKCPNHPKIKIEAIEEENYFFKLSKYSDKIRDLIKKDNIKIRPIKWKNDFLSLIKEGLTDVSFSRDIIKLPWGVPVPNDKEQVMYVWCDALTNYLTGIGYPDKKYERYWPADIHLVGKDMLRFHTGIWPGMLLSAGLSLPKEVIVHGFLTVGGKKMSKSTGNVVSPLDLLKKYSADSLRYALIRATPFGDDGDFSEQALIERHNGELANKLGNLVSRVSGLIEKNGIEKCDVKLLKKFKIKEIEKLIDNLELDKALNEIFAFIDLCNEYIQSKKPWETKDKKILYEVKECILEIAKYLGPFIPESSEKIIEQFNAKNIKKGEILFKKI